MTTREVTQHPNLKALGTTLILFGSPAAVLGIGVLVATYAAVIAWIIFGLLFFAGVVGFVRVLQDDQMSVSLAPAMWVLLASLCIFAGIVISHP